MFTKGKLMFLYSEELVHPGSGEGVGAIDLPIQREKITSWPIIQASGIKGTIREHFETKIENNNLLFFVFGPDPDKGGDPSQNAGAVSFTDAKVLLFPVRSLKGTFAYVTCPLAITRLRKDLETLRDISGTELLDDNFEKAKELESLPIQDEQIVVPQNISSRIVIDGNNTQQVVLEEYALNVQAEDGLDKLVTWLKDRWEHQAPWVDIERRIALVSDNTFQDFVEMSTEVITRIKINDDTGVVEKGALWTEEYLPRETLLYSLVLASKPFGSNVPDTINSDEKVLNYVTDKNYNDCRTPNMIWLGGNLTIGKGLLRVKFI